MARAGALLLAVLLALWPAATLAQTEAGAKDAGSVVMRQLEAFRRDDFDTAFTFASAEIRQLFDRARFEQMVRTGYPEIARSASAVVDGVQPGDAGQLYLFVRVRGANGRSVEAVYEMVLEDGRWHINGVITRPDPGEKA
jgi:multidrug efflux pump subunit AcrA (membrane-fusion protein)